MTNNPEIELTRQSAEQFIALLANTKMLADLLKLLHEMRVLEKILPDFKHARGLLQFNEYHKYTVDEHTLRAIGILTEFEQEQTAKGKAYRSIQDKSVLHLALLLHDLGKGYPEDHCQVGVEIASATGERLGLSDDDTKTIQFLIRNHLLMSHLAFHRDINDEEMVAEFAANVGSVRLLSMLYVLTCADIDAVGPGVLTPWKQELLTDLYRHAKNILTGHREDDLYLTRQAEFYQQIADTVDDPEISTWLNNASQNLPRNYCEQHEPQFISEQLLQLREVIAEQVQCTVGRVKGRNLIELCIGKRKKRRAGVFLSSDGSAG